MTRHLTARERAAVARSREFTHDREDDQRAIAEMNRRKAMTTTKTAQGDRVPRFPDAVGLLDEAATVRSELTELYDLAAEMADRAQRMDEIGRADQSSRFPALREG